MTFRELLEKGEGTIYLVNKNNPVMVSDYDCVIMTCPRFREVYGYSSYFYHDSDFIIARKSKAKDGLLRNGLVKIVSFSNSFGSLFFRREHLDTERYQYENLIVFTSKEDACDYVIAQIRKKKLELNTFIIKATKMKFSVTE